MKSLLAITALVAAASFTSMAHAQEAITLGTPGYGGTGCPGGSVSATLSPDATSLSLLFDSYVVEAGGDTGKTFDRKACNIAIPVHVPQGMSVSVLAIDDSAQVEVAEAFGYPVVREAYADRAYQPNGLLVPRSEPGAVLHDAGAIAERAVRLARAGELVAIDGSVIRSRAPSLCIPGDPEEAVAIARAVRLALEAEGVAIRAPY